jgi:predicted MPP superfamily phosphohydrolase
MLLKLAVLLLFAVAQTTAVASFINRVPMRMAGGPLKDTLIVGLGLIWVPGALLLILLGWGTPTIQGFLTLRPETVGASALVALLAAETLLLIGLGVFSVWGRLRPVRVPGLRSMTTEAVSVDSAPSLPGFALTTSDLRLIRIEIELPKLPPAFDGMRLLHLSDLHVEFAGALAQRTIDLAQDLRPDMIALTGDFIVSRVTPDLECFLEGIRRLNPPLGAWAIRGNHDIWHDSDAVIAAMERRGIPLLTNRGVTVEHDGARLHVVGVEHPWNPVESWDTLLPECNGECRLVLSHTPDTLEHVATRGADLVLAGHTHGGQWRLPLVGSMIVPSNRGAEFDQGLFQRNRSVMWVTRGIGTVGVPLRINCPPEITLLTLRSPGARRAGRAHAEERANV